MTASWVVVHLGRMCSRDHEQFYRTATSIVASTLLEKPMEHLPHVHSKTWISHCQVRSLEGKSK